MRKYLLLAAVAAAAIASPAVARDGSPYVGIEGGLLIDGDLDLDVDIDYDGSTYEYDDALEIDFKRSVDLDLIAGYDFGIFRLEAELGYKKLRADKVEIEDDLDDEFIDDDFDLDGSGSVWSLMANGLLDFGDDDGWSGYVGGGIGRARVKFEGDRDSAFAWQFIAGIRKAISPTVDLGLKYRYFRTGNLEFSDEFDAGEAGIIGFETDGKLKTHSILASLIFNFAAPPPPPPPPPPVVEAPPPPPPATQTCPDGSVILATDACPPAPEAYVPPPPPPAPERG